MNTSQRSGMYRKWVRWMDGISRDVVHLFGSRLLWNVFLDVMKANATVQQASHHPGWIAENHAHTLAVGIRR